MRQACTKWRFSSSKEASCGDGHQKIAATEAHGGLDPAFLPTRFRLAEMALEQVVGAKGDELPLLAPHLALGHQTDRRGQIVVADAPGHAPKVLEGTHMAGEKGLLLLAGKGHHKAPPTVGQPHHKDLHRLPHPANDGDGLPPIHLRILPRVKLQWQKERRSMMRLVPARHMQAHACLTALVALGLQEFVHLVSGVLLLAGQVRIFGQQLVGTCPKGPKHRGRLGFGEPVGLRRLIVDGFIDRFARMLLVAGDLSLTLALQVVGPANGFTFFHGDHLQCSYR